VNGDAPAVVRLQGVTHWYGAGGIPARPVLADFSLLAAPGEWLCVLGPSGCGKTTFLNLVAGFFAPRRGKVLCGGRPVAGPGPDRAVVFQEATLFPWLTVAGNVGFGLRRQGLRGEALEAAVSREIARMGLSGHAAKYPHALSGGMRQRVAIARVLALSPAVLLLDEPFSALDLPTRERLQDELLAIWAETGATVLHVTHSVEEAAYCGDRVLVMPRAGGGCVEEVSVDIPRPRERLGREVMELEARLRHALRACLLQTPAATEEGKS